MTRYRKLDNRRGSIRYRDRWHVSRPPTTLRTLAWMLLPVIGTLVGLWLALVWFLTVGAAA